ncbi:MAG: SMP-30/gluconolactonase/LRE family protein [Candidatus Methylacidiphilales bacterium]
MSSTPAPTPLGSRHSQWGEGPVWLGSKLLYVDIKGHALVTWDPATAREESFPVGQEVGFVVPTTSGDWIWGGDLGLYRFKPATGQSTPWLDPESHLPDHRFNDGKVSPDGRLFAGSMSKKRETGSATLYRFDPDGSCHAVFPGVTVSNGLAWSADASTLYYIDTPRREVLRFEYDSRTGSILNPSTAFSTASIDASPDGMCIDTEDNLWITFCHGGCVIQWDPRTGKPLQRIDFPCVETTSCAWGGIHLDELYITSGIHAQKVEPHAGSLFRVTGLNTRGAAPILFPG